MTRNFYAFHFADGKQTTTGDDKHLHIAGQLFKFKTQALRDAWVADGYNHPVPYSYGEHRGTVGSKNLPMGWKTSEAIYEEEIDF